jgi:hypothetical protein
MVYEAVLIFGHGAGCLVLAWGVEVIWKSSSVVLPTQFLETGNGNREERAISLQRAAGGRGGGDCGAF